MEADSKVVKMRFGQVGNFWATCFCMGGGQNRLAEKQMTRFKWRFHVQLQRSRNDDDIEEMKVQKKIERNLYDLGMGGQNCEENIYEGG